MVVRIEDQSVRETVAPGARLPGVQVGPQQHKFVVHTGAVGVAEQELLIHVGRLVAHERIVGVLDPVRYALGQHDAPDLTRQTFRLKVRSNRVAQERDEVGVGNVPRAGGCYARGLKVEHVDLRVHPGSPPDSARHLGRPGVELGHVPLRSAARVVDHQHLVWAQLSVGLGATHHNHPGQHHCSHHHPLRIGFEANPVYLKPLRDPPNLVLGRISCPVGPIEQGQGGVLIRVKAVPGARRDQVAGLLGDRVKIRVAAPPEAGKANRAISTLLAQAIGVKARQVTLVSGSASPEKTFLVEGASVGQAARALRISPE
ncbi:MAG: DUF167 domain-containing protein [Leptolyngbya sp. PLA3]|nr:MAG: DUF167 domain-containing protein [Cyanobacteria bacterium CYA]MCE7967390.1 DUF167 domain-containing protein [Leptolyngbya sp. PL-A3]